MPHSDMLHGLETRVEDLERRLGTHRRLLALFLGALGITTLLYGQDDPVPQPRGNEAAASEPLSEPPLVVRESITLVDADGNTRALLTAIDDGTSLVLFDSAGVPRAGLTSGYRTSLVLYGEGSRPRAILGATSSIPSHVELPDGTIERAPVSSLVLFDEAGGLVGRLP